jgi:ribosomal protein S18 acetylase RimI-like enzyme
MDQDENRDRARGEALRHDRAPARPAGHAFRRAVPSDAARVAELVDAAYRHYVERIGRKPGPMTADYAQVVRDHHVTVAERDGAVEGVLVLRVTDEGFLVDNVAVHPSRRGTGLGRALLELAEDEARRAGFDSVYLYTHERMTENQALYSRIGYVEYERRSQGGFSLVFMRKRLA